MRECGATVRFAACLALVLALAAALAPFAGSRALAQENGQASITIYTALCPAGFDPDQLFDDCYDNPGADIDYFLLEPGSSETIVATSGANGFAAFEGLTVEGEYSLQVQYPLNLIAVRCSEDGINFPFEFSEIVNQILLDLTVNNDLRCDFYLPAGETPTVAPTSPATQAPQPTSTVASLPSTGAGGRSGQGGINWALAGALVLVVVAAGTLAATRQRLVRVESLDRR